ARPILCASGCATSPQPPPKPSAPVISPPADALLSSCDYRYWHVVPNARWQYRVSSLGSSYPHPSGNMSFTRTEEIAAVTPGEFRVALKSSEKNEPHWSKVFSSGETGPDELPKDLWRGSA